MKYVLFLAGICICLYACKKKTDIVAPPGVYTVPAMENVGSFNTTTLPGVLLGHGRSSILTSDGNVIHTGLTADTQVLLQKTTITGALLWQQQIAIPYGYYLTATSVAEMEQGGFLICGAVDTLLLLIKARNDGSVVWHKNMEAYNRHRGVQLMKTNDGNLALLTSAIYPTSHPYHYGSASVITKLRDDTTALWQYSIALTWPQERRTYGMVENTNGNLLITGGTYGPTIPNINILDAAGNKLAAHNFKPTYGLEAQSAATSDGYVCCVTAPGDSYNNGLLEKYTLIKYNNTGTLLWQETYTADSLQIFDVLLQSNTDGSVILGGSIKPLNGEKDVYIAKVNASGQLLWHKRYKKTGEQELKNIIADKDTYILTGNSNNEKAIFTMRIDRQGNPL